MAFKNDNQKGDRRGDRATVLADSNFGHGWPEGTEVILIRYDGSDDSWWCRMTTCKRHLRFNDCETGDCDEASVLNCEGWCYERDLKMLPSVTDKDIDAAIASIMKSVS